MRDRSIDEFGVIVPAIAAASHDCDRTTIVLHLTLLRSQRTNRNPPNQDAADINNCFLGRDF
jgi:hypothetical protein